MNIASLTRIVGWSAWISAAGTVLTFLTGILFFTIGQPFGTLEDVSSVIQVVFMIPLAIGLYWLILSPNKAVDFLGLAVGILGMLFTCVGQSLLVIGRIDYPTSMKFFPAGLAIGIWLLAACALARASGFFPTGLAWAGLSRVQATSSPSLAFCWGVNKVWFSTLAA